jgi:hypothetical protein
MGWGNNPQKGIIKISFEKNFAFMYTENIVLPSNHKQKVCHKTSLIKITRVRKWLTLVLLNITGDLFTRVARFFLTQYSKTGGNIPNCQMDIQCTK